MARQGRQALEARQAGLWYRDASACLLPHGPDLLDNSAQIHYADLIRCLRHNAQIMGDKNDPHIELVNKVFHQVEHLRLNGHISAVVGSSAISNLGFVDSAIAIIARWRMPPESSKAY